MAEITPTDDPMTTLVYARKLYSSVPAVVAFRKSLVEPPKPAKPTYIIPTADRFYDPLSDAERIETQV